MERLCDLHRGLYNAALQERVDAWRLARKSVGYAEQCRSLTRVRRENPEYLGVNAQSLQVTLKRLDLAFQAFFRRVKAGEDAGLPEVQGPRPLPGLRLQEPRRRLPVRAGRPAGGTAGCGSPGSARCRPGARRGRRGRVVELRRAAEGGRLVPVAGAGVRSHPGADGRPRGGAGLGRGDLRDPGLLARRVRRLPERPAAGRGAGAAQGRAEGALQGAARQAIETCGSPPAPDGQALAEGRRTGARTATTRPRRGSRPGTR